MFGRTPIRSIAYAIALLLLVAPSACEKKGVADNKSIQAAVGSPAPDFALKDMNGRDVRLADKRGKVVLLEFWATWCPPCRETIPDLISLDKKYGGRDLEVISIALDEGSGAAARLKDFSAAHKISYPVLLGKQEIAEAYGVRGVPASFLIDRKGIVSSTHVGLVENYFAVISGEADRLL